MTTTPRPSPKPRSPARRAWWIGAAALAVGVAYGAGRVGAEAPLERRAVARPEPARPPAVAPLEPMAPRVEPAVAAVQAPVAPAAAPAASRRAPPIPPQVMAQYQSEVFTRVEEQRQKVVSDCWPRGGLPKGQRSATVTYQVSFDAQGREIARGVQSDRRAPAGAFASCLSRFRGERFAISPPGRPVTMRVAVSYP